ncbi:hypothetical protein C343_06573 [Cryptococcus neoformans C23]|uniref:Probable RNA polymerase II nuclear localization protein SLC7A6OS n=2 Tax=Cryptococcus neoformans TaxID=5207 RepID=J9W343_CRYN9|nr:hypothetical protein, variant [Cryptococcus neoformans var. grubii H99]XP_012053438.1 hypothetical protein CNAG_06357 [Cryptococcus neoformans var. grubii H99]AUB28767.1 hypothetical protein CKF44_06357 [Cryptococcus neoformans var. grubii]OWZ26922.1 hypothetical protein C347_06571 [Cryptococcus neoformans var. grubii AD2-60a]OWZ27964.1 hypothetical protein C353_06603 [Cryptococcus neoformans var. grubii AD1-83a]OWZ38783.1 hypothetical protein C343_06573 [Cryptococcus neoformans var. grubii|eukprot:XP_012053437.1 hypothetical protein, variant [Cryptococcus neoformans var. grubii H99]
MDVDPYKPTPPSFTVLRIKRKATEPALSSLVIQDEVRTKRRRDIAGKARGVFRLADTVPGNWVGQGEEGEVLKSRIQGLLSSQPSASPLSSSPQGTSLTTAPQEPLLPPVGQPPANFPVPPSAIEQTQIPTPSPPILPEAAPSTSNNRRSSSMQAQMQYRVIPPMSPRTKAMLPPRILTAAETEGREKTSPFVFVDAQAVEMRSQKGITQEDKDLAAFLPMLQEYLRLEQQDEKAREEEGKARDDEWVYDLYYRDSSGSLPLDIGAGDGVTIGQLLGFESTSPPSSISGSEPEDEADEDSNDEDYYRNDYPEDEDADEDMVGFRGGGDSDWSEDEEDDYDYDERNEWGYR